MIGSYLTGLGQPVGAPDPGLPVAYQEAIRLLNKTPHARIWIQHDLPGMVKWMAGWATKIATDSYVKEVLTQARTEWLPKLIAQGYDAEAKQIQGALDYAGNNAKRMAEKIVRYRKEATYKDWLRDQWAEFSIGWSSSNARTINITSERAWNLLQPYEDEDIRKVRWTPHRTMLTSGLPDWQGAQAVLGPRQYTSFDMDLKWDAIEQSVERIQLAMEDVEFKKQDKPVPPRPALPPIPKNPTPANPSGANGTAQSVIGVVALAGIGWWWWNRSRVQSP